MLIKCKTCEKDIGDTAVFCPHCGARVPPPFGVFVAWGFAAFVILSLVVYSLTL